MPKNLQKSLQDYLSKIKKPSPHIRSIPISSSTSWMLSRCKHPKTLSFTATHNKNESHEEDDAVTLSDIDRFLSENFKSLYGKNNDEEEKEGNQNRAKEARETPGAMVFESPRFFNLPPDLCGSHRFFVKPGMSSSLMEDARLSATSMSDDMGSSSTTTTTTLNYSMTASNDDDNFKEVSLPDDTIAVLTYSPNPYNDFRRSMQEMVEARLHHHAKVDWEFMEELLFCYLNLNEKKSHKYILSAFVDLIVVLRQNSGEALAKSRNDRVERDRRKKKVNM